MSALDDLVWSELHAQTTRYVSSSKSGPTSPSVHVAAVALVRWHAEVLAARTPRPTPPDPRPLYLSQGERTSQ